MESISQCHQSVYDEILKDAVVISDPYKFQRFYQIFSGGYDIVVLYSNEKNPQVSDSCSKIIQNLRINFPVQSEKDANKIIFVVAKTPEVIMPLQTEFKSGMSGIQMLFLPAKLISENVVVDTIKTHLPKLATMEDMTVKKYVKMVKNKEREFKVYESDSEEEKERKESSGRIFTPERF